MASRACPFCRALEDNEVDVVFENDEVLVILDRMPINRGHVLVIPRRHSPDLLDLTACEVQQMALFAQKSAIALREVLGVTATNLLMSNGPAADQDVPHAHLHVIPREVDDGFEFREDTSRYPLAPLSARDRNRLQQALNGAESACRGVS